MIHDHEPDAVAAPRAWLEDYAASLEREAKAAAEASHAAALDARKLAKLAADVRAKLAARPEAVPVAPNGAPA